MAAGRTRKLIFNWHMERAQIKSFIEYIGSCLINTSQCLSVCILPVFIPCRSVAVKLYY